jgi:hypothetical protein
LLCEYGLTPEYVNDSWTEELLALMMLKRRERIETVSKGKREQLTVGNETVLAKRVSNEQFFQATGLRVKKCQIQ